MGRRSHWVRSVALASGLACCGAPFTAAGPTDGGSDSTSPVVDGSGDTSSDGSGGGGDATSDASQDGPAQSDGVAPHDAPSDVAQEAPPSLCAGGFACVAAPPGGWSGPGEIYAQSSAPPPCTTDFADAYDGNAELSSSPATCDCSCSAPTTECETPKLAFSTTNTCNSTCDSVTLTPGTCTTVNAQSACNEAGVAVLSYLSAPASVPVANSGCGPLLSKTLPPPTWSLDVRACASTVELAQSSCQSGSVCAPVPASPYSGGLCIWQTGDVSCPSAGPYSVKHTFYGGFTDTRDCGACTCGSLTGASCAASFDVYGSTNASCTGAMTIYEAPVTCDGSGFDEDIRLDITTTAGSCTPGGGTPSGTVDPASPTTFCCPS